MKHKKLLAFFSAALLLLFAGCDYVDLKSGASVSLTVETVVAQYSVDSSYGEVSGGNGSYTISVPDKRDFLISVSAEGYTTATVPVTVADLASGSCEKTVHFGDALNKELTVDFSGVTDGCKILAGEKEFTGKGSKVTAELTREELERGITATAEGAEPKKITFTKSQLDSSYLSASVRLVETGNKLVTVHNADTMTFALDDEDKLLPLEIESEDRYDEFGYRTYYTGYLTLPLSYMGTIRMRKVYDATTLRISVAPSSEPYDSRNEYDFDLDNDYNHANTEYVSLEVGFTQSEVNDYNNSIYVETETVVLRAYLNRQWDYSGFDYVEYSALTFNKPLGDTVKKLYLIKEDWDSNLQMNVRQWSCADYSKTLRPADFKTCDPITPEYGVIEDRTFGGVYTDSTYWQYWDYENHPEHPEQKQYVEFDENGKFTLRDGANLYADIVEYGAYVSTDYEILCKKVDGAWCQNYRIEGYVSYRITVKDEDGNPITGAEVKSKGGNIFQEIGGGVYLLKNDSLGSSKLEVIKDGVTLYGEVSTDPADDSFWTKADSGREVRGELIAKRKALLVIALSYRQDINDNSYNTLSISNVSVSNIGSGCKLTKILSEHSMVYYLLEAEADNISFTVSYRYRSSMNWDYGDLSSYVSESRRIAVTLGDLMNGSENKQLEVQDAYTRIYVNKFQLA